MDLTKKIELYFNDPVIEPEGEIDGNLLKKDSYKKFNAIFKKNDLPKDAHDEFLVDVLLQFYNPKIASEVRGYQEEIKAYFICGETGKAVHFNARNKEEMKEQNIHAGGVFFSTKDAPQIIKEFERANYEIIKKYD